MDNFREAIMEHINKKHTLNPMISILQDRFNHVVSQFHTPDHPPYAAMIQRALLDLNEKGGSTEKSISDFIKSQYDDLPWAHCSFLKHHLGLLSENGEIIVTSGFRYSLCGAGSSSVSIKGGKKRRRKKCRWNFEKKRNKRQKMAIVARSQKENDQNAVAETETGQNDGLQTPEQDGTIGKVLLQLTDGGENDIFSGSKAMDIDPPLLVLTGENENQVVIKQQQLHDPCNLNSMDLLALNNNEDAIQELPSPERAPGFEFMGVEASNGQVSIVNSHLSQISELIEQREVLLSLPHPQNGSLLLGDGPMQDERSQRQLRRWSVNLPVSHTEKVSSSLANPGKCSSVEITSDIEKSYTLKKLPPEYTFITRSQRQSGAPRRPVSVSPSPSTDLQQDEGSNSQGVFELLALPQHDRDVPVRIYRRRGRHRKENTDTVVQDELPPADIQKQQAEELPNLPSLHVLQEKTPEEAPTKVEFTFPNHKDNSDKDHQLEISKPRGRGRPPKRKLVVNKGKDDRSSPRNHQQHAPIPNHKDNNDKDQPLEPTKARVLGKPPNRKLVVNKGNNGRSSPRNHRQLATMPRRGSRQSPRNMLKRSYHLRDKKIQKKC